MLGRVQRTPISAGCLPIRADPARVVTCPYHAAWYRYASSRNTELYVSLTSFACAPANQAFCRRKLSSERSREYTSPYADANIP